MVIGKFISFQDRLREIHIFNVCLIIIGKFFCKRTVDSLFTLSNHIQIFSTEQDFIFHFIQEVGNQILSNSEPLHPIIILIILINILFAKLLPLLDQKLFIHIVNNTMINPLAQHITIRHKSFIQQEIEHLISLFISCILHKLIQSTQKSASLKFFTLLNNTHKALKHSKGRLDIEPKFLEVEFSL